jgi:ornithine--oxo-acid transaminase
VSRYIDGSAIPGGVYPVSAVLANDTIMNAIQPGQHRILLEELIAAAVAIAALGRKDENLAQNAAHLAVLRNGL